MDNTCFKSTIEIIIIIIKKNYSMAKRRLLSWNNKVLLIGSRNRMSEFCAIFPWGDGASHDHVSI